MNAFLTDVRLTLAPARGSKDGLLPPLLVGLTAVTGLVDAFSYLVLGHVFVANMTGNVVFLAFALAGMGGSPRSPRWSPGDRLAHPGGGCPHRSRAVPGAPQLRKPWFRSVDASRCSFVR